MDLCGKLKNREKKCTSAMRKLFPASSVGVKRKTPIFDPTSECVFAVQQKRKKAARLKPTNITLTLIDNVSKGVPRGKYKTELKDKDMCIKVPLFRTLSGQQVRTAFLKELLPKNVLDYKLLQCVGQQLVESLDQVPSGGDIIDSALKRKGNVMYIHPVWRRSGLMVSCAVFFCLEIAFGFFVLCHFPFPIANLNTIY